MTDRPASPDLLDRRLDASLRRTFAPPASLDSLAAKSAERARPRRRRGSRLLPWLALAGAAAAGVGLFLSRGEGSATPTERSGPEPRVASEADTSPAVEPEPSFCRLVGPLVEGVPAGGTVHTPDLVRLYHDMDACQRGAEVAVCSASDGLAQRLSETYDQPLGLRPEAAGLLHGPFGDDDWPTATMFTGTSGDQTSLLVADRGSTLACCVNMDMPEGSGLRLFTWQVGEVVLTEITPSEEPRLLPYFQ